MRVVIYIIMLSVFTSCLKEEDPMVLPPPGDLTYVVADIGTDYSKAVYLSLKNNTQVTRNWEDWDLAFDASENGGFVYENTGKFMFVCHTNSNDFASADSTGKIWKMDNDQLQDDSNAIGRWWDNGSSDVMVVDRGRILYTGLNAMQRYKKIKLESVNSLEYKLSFCDYGSSTPVSFTITKQPDHSLVYFTFDNGGKIVDMEPSKDNWDFVLTRYTHIYYGEPVGSPYRFYPVNGGLNNKWNGITGIRMVKDSTPGFIPFNEIKVDQATSFNFSANANTIGFEWKSVDISTGIYSIKPDIYYLLKDKDGYIYKLRFIDFYDQNGNKGAISFEYQRL